MMRKLPAAYREKARSAIAQLVSEGYTEEVRSFTKSIASNPAVVMGFEEFLNVFLKEDETSSKEDADQYGALKDMAALSLMDMQFFLAGASGLESTACLTMLNHGQEITVEIGWQSQKSGYVVWDRWTQKIDDPVMAFVLLGALVGIKTYRCEPKSVEKPLPPLYRYHPERFKAYRDYADMVGKIYRQKVDPASGLLTVDQLNEIGGGLMTTEMNQRGMQFPRKLKDGFPSPSLVMDSEIALATSYGRFVQAGRQIMDFPPALTEMLVKTDVDDIPLNNIKMPYAAQYLYFGPQDGMEIEDEWLVDGAYVEFRGTEGDIRFTVTASPKDRSLSRMWFMLPEPEYTQDFVGEYRSMDLATAMDTVLSAKLASLRERRLAAGGEVMQHEGVSVVDNSPKMAAERVDIDSRRYPVYRDALRLVVNALCYVTAYPDDIETVWPKGTPESLKQKVLQGKGKEVQRAKSKLAALGYVPIHVCGNRIVEQPPVTHGGRGGHALHWRRGHWRNQVHGPARSLRKLIWVMPVLVGSRDGDDEPLGHLYLVS